MKAPSKAWIVGAGAHGRVVLDILRAASRYASIGFIDDDARIQGTHINGAEIVGGLDAVLACGCEGVEVIVALGNPLDRLRLSSMIADRGIPLANAIHPSAVIMGSVQTGCGTFVGAGAVVNSGARVGDQVIINSGAVVEHDCVLEDGSAVGPGATLGGRAHLERCTFVGAGATVIGRIRIGRETVIGAGAVVTRNLPAKVLAWGVPARVIEHIPDFDWKRVL